MLLLILLYTPCDLALEDIYRLRRRWDLVVNFGKGTGFGVLLAEVEALSGSISIHSVQLSERVVELVLLAEAASVTMLPELSWVARVCSLLY